MFLRRLSAVVVIVTCFGWAAMGAVLDSRTTATNNEEENFALAPLSFPILNDSVCYGASDGSLKVMYSGSKTVQTFSILNAVGNTVLYGPYSVSSSTFYTGSFKLLPAGTYTIKLKFSDSSEDTNTGTIFQPDVALSLTGAVTNPDCSGGKGTITLTGAGGFTPYTYVLKNSSGTVMTGSGGVYTNLTAGQYFGEVTDKTGCLESNDGSLVVVVPDAIATPSMVIDSIDYPGEKAVITLTGLPSDSTTYQILLNGSSSGALIIGTTAVISNISAGNNQTLRVQRNGCSNDFWATTFNIIDYAAISLSWDHNPNNVTINCYGQDTTLTVTVNGGRAGKTVSLILLEDGVERDLATNLPFGTSYPISDLYAGKNYILYVKISDDYDLFKFSFKITGPAIPFQIVNVTSTDVTCADANNGKVLISYAGGTGTISYYLNGTYTGQLSSNKTITGLDGLSYEIVLQDNNGCFSNDTLATIAEPDPLSISVLTDLTQQLTCPNSTTGSITAKTYGGKSPYYYTLRRDGVAVSPFENLQGDSVKTFSNLQEGSYTISVKDGYCPDSATDVEVIEALDVTLVIQYDSIHCYNGTTDLFVTATSTTANLFTYTLTDNTTGTVYPAKSESSAGAGVTFSGIQGSSYRIGAYFGTCDPITKDTVIFNPDSLQVIYSDTVKLNCYGDSTSVTIRALGNSPFYISEDGINYTKFTGSNYQSITLTNLTAGDYSYYIKDNIGCVYKDGSPINIRVNSPTAVTVVDGSVVVVNESCIEKDDGQISLMLEGGSGKYYTTISDGTNSYKKSSTTGSFLFSNVPYGTYSFIITDGKKCPAVNLPEPVLVDQPDTFVIEEPVFDELKCYGDSVDIMFNVTGGWGVNKQVNVSHYGYTSGYVPSDSVFSLKAENYTIAAVDDNGCKATMVLNIVQPTKLRLKITDYSPVSCNGSNDASISIKGIGGTKPYSYILVGSGMEPVSFAKDTVTIKGELDQATYWVQLNDANGCPSNIDSVTITEPSVVEFTIRQGNYEDSVKCFGQADGGIFLYGSGGNENGYKAFITPNGGIERSATYPSISNLSAGIYSVRIEDNSGCTSISKLDTVNGPNEIIVDDVEITDSVSCYNLADASITIKTDPESGLPYGLEYKVTGTDVKGNPVNIGYQTDPIFEGLRASNVDGYQVLVRLKNDRGNCIADPIELHIENPLDITVVDPIDKTNVSCHNAQDGSVNIIAAGGTGTLTYQLDPVPSGVSNTNTTGSWTEVLGNPNVSSTTYTYIIKDQNECSKNGTITISNPDEIILTEVSHFQVRCNGEKNGWIKVNAKGGNGGYTFKNDESDNSITSYVDTVTAYIYTLTNLDGGLYNPVVIDSKGCSDTIQPEIEIIDPELFLIKDVDWGIKLCNYSMDDSTIIHVEGGTAGFYYSLDGGSSYGDLNDSIFVGESIGSKVAMAKDINGCITPQWEEYLLQQPDYFSVETEIFGLDCWYSENGDLELKISGGTGPYTFAYNDPTFSSNTLNIVKSETDTTTVKLSDEGIKLKPDITYRFYLHDNNNCHVQNISGIKKISTPFDSILFTKPEMLILKDLIPKPVRCGNDNDGVIEFKAERGDSLFENTITSGYVFTAKNVARNYTRRNDPGSTKADELFAGFHECILKDVNGCFAATRLTNFKCDSANIYWGIDTVTVVADYDTIQVYFNDTIQPQCNTWFNGSISVDINNFRSDGVTYYVDKWIESENRYETISTDSLPADSAYSDNAEDNAFFYLVDQTVAEEIGIGLYRVVIKDNYTQCTDTIPPFLITSISGDSCPPESYYNVFTPNGDSIHDSWEIYGSSYTKYSLQIYTALGQLIYSSPIITSGEQGIKWDGLDDFGRPAPVGTYIYLLREYDDMDRPTSTKPKDGNITILRGNGR